MEKCIYLILYIYFCFRLAASSSSEEEQEMMVVGGKHSNKEKDNEKGEKDNHVDIKDLNPDDLR